ncbi:MAG: NAD(P)/FAD-dependent oxidoreductase [Polyangiaceae bacterium]
MDAHCDVAVIGGGVAGMACAAALAARGRAVTVLEGHQGEDPRLRGELIQPFGVELLERLSLLRELRTGTAEVGGFAILPGEGREAIVLPYSDLALNDAALWWPPRGLAGRHNLISGRIRASAAARPGVRVLTGERVTGLLREAGRIVGVRAGRGREIRAELTVIAGGRHTRLREMAGIAAESRLLSWTATCQIDRAALPHADFGNILFTSLGPVLVYPVSATAAAVSIECPLSIGSGREQIRSAIEASVVPSLPPALGKALLASLRSGPMELCANHSVQPDRHAVPGAVLVGDAAGCSHPITASGITSGLHDAVTLGAALGGAVGVDGALELYEQRRRRFAETRRWMADAIHDVLTARDSGARALREALFEYWMGSARARAASLSLLSCHTSSWAGFAAEYTLVCGLALRSCFKEQSTAARPVERVTGVMRTSIRQALRLLGSSDRVPRRAPA